MKCRQDQNLWLAGDQVSHASIESALASGLQAADEVLSSL
jgi:predicted NAD/FAD-dependent oxidoreductase